MDTSKNNHNRVNGPGQRLPVVPDKIVDRSESNSAGNEKFDPIGTKSQHIEASQRQR